MYRSESFGCLKCNTKTKVVMTPVPCIGTTGPMVLTPVPCTGSTGPMVVTSTPCTGSNGPMVMTGPYELRAAVYKEYQLSPKVSASCVSAAFRVASHTGTSCTTRSNGVRSVRHSEGCHTVSLYVLLHSHLHTNRTVE
jgi:hypothetical protein